MKRLIIGLCLLATCTFSQQESFARKAYETKVSYMKKDVEAFAADFNVSKDVLSNIAEQYFNENIKGKRKKNKDFYMYQGVNYQEIFGTEKGDFYYKVTGNKSSSKLIVLVSKGYDNFVSQANDQQIANNTKALLNNFEHHIEKYNKAQLIKAQQELINKTEKEKKNLEDEYQRTSKKLDDLQKQIDKKGKEIDEQKAKLEELQKL